MTSKTITLPIPALAMHRPVEEVMIYALKRGSPLAWDDVPVEFQADLAEMD